MVLLELSKKRESFADLAPILWHSTGTVAALLQEIVSIYSLLTPPTLTAHASNRVCNALALLQCVASHADTRQPFLAANMYVDRNRKRSLNEALVANDHWLFVLFCAFCLADLYIFIRF